MGVDLLNIKGLKELEHQGPIVMVNLMRFRERSLDGNGSGWDAYLRYSALTVPMIKARGGTLLWTGDAKAVALGEPGGNQWDYLALAKAFGAKGYRATTVTELNAVLLELKKPTTQPSLVEVVIPEKDLPRQMLRLGVE